MAIKYGSNDDSEEKMGDAHFLEHMLVGGSNKGSGSIMKSKDWVVAPILKQSYVDTIVFEVWIIEACLL